jgi:hypothetical protein
MVLMPALFKNRPYSVGIFFAVNSFFRFKNKRTVRFNLPINEIYAASNRASATQTALAGALAAPITAQKKSRPASKLKIFRPPLPPEAGAFFQRVRAVTPGDGRLNKAQMTLIRA